MIIAIPLPERIIMKYSPLVKNDLMVGLWDASAVPMRMVGAAALSNAHEFLAIHGYKFTRDRVWSRVQPTPEVQ